MRHTYSQPKSLTSTTQLDELVALISARVEAGEPIDLAALTVDCPELREQLEMLLPTLQAVVEFEQSFAHVGESLRKSHSPLTDALPSSAEHPASSIQHRASSIQHPAAGLLGDFRILRELGRGGMGVVYEAEQISLGRRVALKVLPFAAMLDRQQLARFKNEARAAATLDHPNIVAIYSVGVERSVHYYAMQLIEGQSLAQVVEKLRIADCGLRIEEASPQSEIRNPKSEIETRPVAHSPTLPAPCSSLPAFSSRDYYRTIARLGIQAAEALDHAHASGILHRDIKPANLLVECSGIGNNSLKLWITDFGLARIEQDAGMTMTGDILGTLRYMSPEQALARRAIVDHRSDIYSLGVTLYELLTLHPTFDGEDRQELLRQIAFEEPLKPRQINSHIPQDLETVVRKAIEKNPADRYATAQQLADDLRRFVDDRPIVAKPPNMWAIARKWSRRNRPLVASAAVSVAALVLISLFLLASRNVAITRERNEKAAALDEKTAALKRADRNLQMVLTVIDQCVEDVGDQALAGVPQMEQLRKRLLGDALDFYEKLLLENPNDPALSFATAQAYVRFAMITHEFAQWDKASELNDKAITVLDELVRTDPSNPSYRFELGTALKQQAWNPVTGRVGAARRAIDIFQALFDEQPDNIAYREALLFSLGTLTTGADLPEREAIVERMRPLVASPNIKKLIVGFFHIYVADLHQHYGRLEEAEGSAREAVRILNAGVKEDPSDLRTREHVVRESNRLGRILVECGKLEDAVAIYKESFQAGETLRRDFPAMKFLNEFTYDALRPLATNLIELGRTDEAIAIVATMTVRDPADFETRAALYLQLGQRELAMADYQSAADWWTNAIEHHSLIGDSWSNAGYPYYEMSQIDDAVAPWYFRGRAYVSLGQYDKAIDDFSKALERAPDDPDLLLIRGNARMQFGQHVEGIADYERAIAVMPDDSKLLNNLAWYSATATNERLRNGKRAVDMATKACKLTDYKNATFVDTLAAAYAESGDFEAAVKWQEKAIELLSTASPGFSRRLESFQAGRPWREQ